MSSDSPRGAELVTSEGRGGEEGESALGASGRPPRGRSPALLSPASPRVLIRPEGRRLRTGQGTAPDPVVTERWLLRSPHWRPSSRGPLPDESLGTDKTAAALQRKGVRGQSPVSWALAA